MDFHPPFLGEHSVHLLHSVTLFYIFYVIVFYHLKTHLWMIMMESRFCNGLKYNPSEIFDNY